MKLDFQFFKPSGKYYTTDSVEIPTKVVEGGVYEIARWCHENREMCGYENMHMLFIETENNEKNVSDCFPFMVPIK